MGCWHESFWNNSRGYKCFNMIKQIKDTQDFFTICDKLKEVKNCRMDSNTLFTYMSCYPDVLTYASVDKDDVVTGCLVVRRVVDIVGDLIFFVLFQWRDSRFPELRKEFVQFASEQAKQHQVKKIVFTSSRKDKVIERAIGKYGFRKAYSVFEKEVV